jgi:hypothetical protein
MPWRAEGTSPGQQPVAGRDTRPATVNRSSRPPRFRRGGEGSHTRQPCSKRPLDTAGCCCTSLSGRPVACSIALGQAVSNAPRQNGAVARLRRCHARMAVRTALSGDAVRFRAAPTDRRWQPRGLGARWSAEGPSRTRSSVCLLCPTQNSPAGTGRYSSAGHDSAPQIPLPVIRLLVDYQTEEWLSSVVPGAFAGPWTPLPPPLPGANPFRGGRDRTRRKAAGYGWRRSRRLAPPVWSMSKSTARLQTGRALGRGVQVRLSYECHKVRRVSLTSCRAESVRRLPVPRYERRGSY